MYLILIKSNINYTTMSDIFGETAFSIVNVSNKLGIYKTIKPTNLS